MLRFLGFRILAAIPVLFVMSMITFVIIQAPPGDYGDYIRNQLLFLGNASTTAADAAAEKFARKWPERSMIVQFFAGSKAFAAVILGIPFYNNPISVVIGELLPERGHALTCPILASLFGIASSSSPPRANTRWWYLLSIVSSSA